MKLLFNKINLTHSLYAVHLNVNNDVEVSVGKLGIFLFPKGIYIYIGSAKKNIEARLRRHNQVEKKLRWHFDYLRPYGEIVKIETFNRDISECDLYEKMMRNLEGQVIVKGFGASDCKCRSHLIYLPGNEIDE